jgi:hypothetical protein
VRRFLADGAYGLAKRTKKGKTFMELKADIFATPGASAGPRPLSQPELVRLVKAVHV